MYTTLFGSKVLIHIMKFWTDKKILDPKKKKMEQLA